MKYKAIFFDRDGTLTYFNPVKEKLRDEMILSWSGRRLEMSYEKMMHLFEIASEGRKAKPDYFLMPHFLHRA